MYGRAGRQRDSARWPLHRLGPQLRRRWRHLPGWVGQHPGKRRLQHLRLLRRNARLYEEGLPRTQGLRWLCRTHLQRHRVLRLRRRPAVRCRRRERDLSAAPHWLHHGRQSGLCLRRQDLFERVRRGHGRSWLQRQRGVRELALTSRSRKPLLHLDAPDFGLRVDGRRYVVDGQLLGRRASDGVALG